ncbi:spore maturation protein [Clostridia bacterium]|nr:spore maturation protein [Clostridia bacterium]
MMNVVIAALFGLSLVSAAVTGHMGELSGAAVTSAGSAVALIITLAGIICLWSGIMRVCQAAGITGKLTRLLLPVLRRLFSGVNPGGKAMEYISLNVTANLLGLGNATTPLGVKAMKALEEETEAEAAKTETEAAASVQNTSTPTANMTLLTVLNTASLQILPTTVAALRLKHGSAAPMEILPAVWLVSTVCVTLTVIFTKVWCSGSRAGGR